MYAGIRLNLLTAYGICLFVMSENQNVKPVYVLFVERFIKVSIVFLIIIRLLLTFSNSRSNVVVRKHEHNCSFDELYRQPSINRKDYRKIRFF